MIGDHWSDGWEAGYPENGECLGYDVFVSDKPQHSELLGPDGHPLEYEDQPFGFDLRGKP